MEPPATMPDVRPRKRRRSMSVRLLARFARATQCAQNAPHVKQRHRAVLALEATGAPARGVAAGAVAGPRQSIKRFEPDRFVDEQGRLDAVTLHDERPGPAGRGSGLEPEKGTDVHERQD